ncbi:MAG: amidohydrolase family protein [Jatrophihabitans sp.]
MPAADMSPFDLVIANGRWFDGTGASSAIKHLGIRADRIVAVSDEPLDLTGCPEIVDAAGKWVTPGFVDIHTHYDAEVLVAPGLTESVRHGVTTVLIGNCSLSTVYADALDAADLFSRVEALPRPQVLAALSQAKTWTSPESYLTALEQRPLGPNIAPMLGHSDVRAYVMGLDRSTDENVTPTKSELARMHAMLSDALDAGYLGMSTMTNPWDKLDGDRFRSRQLPSSYARWRENWSLNRILRRRGRVLQSIPNLNTKVNVALFLTGSTGIGRKPLKTSLLSAADPKSDPWLYRIFGPLARIVNGPGRGHFRWQHLPVPFQVYADGIDLVVFEEFGAGRAALHLQDELARNKLLSDPEYRRTFRVDYEKKFAPRVWHRDFHDAEIVECPDASVVGKTIGSVADERGIHVVDAFLDLVVEHGRALRWRTTITNARPEILEKLAQQPGIQIGFSDAGAHLRNMAFYNFGIRFLRRVHEAEQAGKAFLTLERAVHMLTGDLADFFDIDAGRIRVGDRADLVVIDPAGLDASTDDYHEEPLAEFDGLRRMVNRNDAAVCATIIAGDVVYRAGTFSPGYGRERRTGRVLRAGRRGGSTSIGVATAKRRSVPTA